MCVATVIIHTKTLEKKAVDDVASTESLQLHEPPTMSQGTALFSFGIMESGRWPEVGGVCGVQQRPVGSSLESLWDSVRETCSAREAGAAGGISGLLHDLSLSEAPSPGSAAPPSKRQCRSLSCSGELGCRSSWRPQGSRVWTAVEKRRCHSGGSVQRGAFAPSGFPAMQRSFSFSLPTRINPPETFSHGFPFSASPQTPQALYLSHEQICPTESSSPDSTPELEHRRQGLARSRSQPCVHNDKKTGVKRRRPADSHKHRPSLDLLKMTQKLQDFHSLSCPGFTGDEQTLHDEGDVTLDQHQTKEDTVIHQSEASWSGGKERECLWAGLCSRRGRDSFQLGGELDIEQIERN
ncbi:protein FAM53B [Sinocyclocheilus anshuiensis]|uniref:Protein FAM53B-like n=1 Tax=Sinocyclocheilus anshuiensis TaxID=1608454 RepID=A0A671N6D3_9TELE|nr:PREDICTED: protein FAM53B-like [Sinocyclocheilus anshuiensis]XP_016323848.1 PREDICTED: protein FAM53B-like [Sinocyclocheilus anshuiensis]